MSDRLKNSDLTVLLTIGAILAGLVVSTILGYLDSERRYSNERVAVLSELSTRRAKLEGIISSTFNITQGMVYIISHQGNISQEMFSVLTNKAMADNPHIRNIAIAPNNVVSMVYPFKGNEQVIGLNYEEKEDQWESVYRAMKSKKPLLAGPVKLVQGGIALIERSPVFIKSFPDSIESYWGMVSIVAHINTIISEADLDDSENLVFLIMGKNGKGINGEPIWGDISILNMNPVFLELDIPGGNWVIMGVPKKGWLKNSPFKSLFFLIGLVNTILLLGFLLIMINKNKSIRKKNFDLNNTIEERNKISDALSLSETKYRNLIEEMRDVLVIIDQNGIITYCSPSIKSFGGYNVETFEGSYWRNYIMDTSEGPSKEEIAGSIMLSKHERLELVFIPKTGEPFYIEVAIRAVNISDGVINYHCVFRNIKERKQMVVELIKSKEAAEAANRMKSSFLANMSHEVRTPMNAILGFTDILMKSKYEEYQTKQYLEIIHNSSYQLLNLINDIIDISLIESSQLKIVFSKFKIKRVFDQVLLLHKMAAAQKGLLFKLEEGLLDVSEIEIYSDETRIIQVMNNLIGNAIKFTHEGSITLGYEMKTKTIRFYVRDTGIGIAPDYHNVIFERFRQVDERYSRKYGGTGLGLSICKSVIEMIGGKIAVKSEPGIGSIFYFDIPVNGEPGKLTVSSFE